MSKEDRGTLMHIYLRCPKFKHLKGMCKEADLAQYWRSNAASIADIGFNAEPVLANH